MTDSNEMEQVLFQLILHAGSARSFAKEAGQYAEEGDWEAADKALEEANKEAERIIAEAQQEADSIIKKAQAHVDKIMQLANQSVTDINLFLITQIRSIHL